MNIIVERIELQRKKLNLTQKELCQKCNIVDTTYSSWKNRGRLPSIDEIVTIADNLNVTIEWLATGKEHIEPGTVLPENEQQLLDYYHAASPDGQNQILKHAKYIATEYPKALGKSSEYKIG